MRRVAAAVVNMPLDDAILPHYLLADALAR